MVGGGGEVGEEGVDVGEDDGQEVTGPAPHHNLLAGAQSRSDHSLDQLGWTEDIAQDLLGHRGWGRGCHGGDLQPLHDGDDEVHHLEPAAGVPGLPVLLQQTEDSLELVRTGRGCLQ